MKQRLNRYIIHEMDFIPQSKLDEMLKLYMNPLGRPLQYWFMRGMLFFGKNFTKKWAYRFLDLSQNQLTK